jgi:uncharacterized membrane protein
VTFGPSGRNAACKRWQVAKMRASGKPAPDMDYLVAKWLHVLSATLLFGTGVGTAWYMLFASLSRDARAVAVVMRHGVRADWLFTATTLVVQPLSGWFMVERLQLPWSTPWLAWSIGLYALAVACWLPVVGLQLRMRDLAEDAARHDRPLPQRYFRLLAVWAALGVPAALALLVVFFLMVAKPA